MCLGHRRRLGTGEGGRHRRGADAAESPVRDVHERGVLDSAEESLQL